MLQTLIIVKFALDVGRTFAIPCPNAPEFVLPAQAGIQAVGPKDSGPIPAGLYQRHYTRDSPDYGFLRNDGSGTGTKGANPRYREPNAIALGVGAALLDTPRG